MSNTYRRPRVRGFVTDQTGRVQDRDCYHEPKSYRRVGDRVMRDYVTDGLSRTRLARAAERRVLRDAIDEIMND